MRGITCEGIASITNNIHQKVWGVGFFCVWCCGWPPIILLHLPLNENLFACFLPVQTNDAHCVSVSIASPPYLRVFNCVMNDLSRKNRRYPRHQLRLLWSVLPFYVTVTSSDLRRLLLVELLTSTFSIHVGFSKSHEPSRRSVSNSSSYRSS